MAQNGLRVGSGVTIGIFGAAIGIHASLAWSAVMTIVVCAALGMLARTPRVTIG